MNISRFHKKAFQWDAYCPFAPTIRASIATRCPHQGDLEVNKFEEVCSDLHQMSLADGVGLGGVPRSHAKGVRLEVQCIMGNGHMGTPCELTDRPTRLKTHFPETSLAGGNKNSSATIMGCVECWID